MWVMEIEAVLSYYDSGKQVYIGWKGDEPVRVREGKIEHAGSISQMISDVPQGANVRFYLVKERIHVEE